jgi:hypothetical protein
MSKRIKAPHNRILRPDQIFKGIISKFIIAEQRPMAILDQRS